MVELRRRTVCPVCDRINSVTKRKHTEDWRCYKCGWVGQHPKQEMRPSGKGVRNITSKDKPVKKLREIDLVALREGAPLAVSHSHPITRHTKGELFRKRYDATYDLSPVIELTDEQMIIEKANRRQEVLKTYGFDKVIVGSIAFSLLSNQVGTGLPSHLPVPATPISHGANALDTQNNTR